MTAADSTTASMNACVLHAIGDLRIDEVPRPVPRAGELLVRVGACGVCGSDIPRIFNKGTYSFPMIPGHECAGEVVEVGPETDVALLHRRVTVFPLIPCRQCASCKQADYAHCDNYNYLGSRCDGGFAEYVVAPAWNVLPIPKSVSLEEAALTEPAAVALHALRRGDLRKCDTVLIVGAGPIGMLCAMWAQALGAARVLITDIDESKIDFATSLGFEEVYGGDEGAAAWTVESTRGGVDIVIEASGSAGGVATALRSARAHGRVVLLGNPSGDMSLAQDVYWAILRKELTVTGAWNSHYDPARRDEWHETIDAIASGALDAKSLITQRVSLNELYEALTMMRDRSAFTSKILYVNTQ